jgi:hypothetical protein
LSGVRRVRRSGSFRRGRAGGLRVTRKSEGQEHGISEEGVIKRIGAGGRVRKIKFRWRDLDERGKSCGGS